MRRITLHLAVSGLLALTLAEGVRAQTPPGLRITEVMTKATMNQYPAFRGTDFWELTNFGTNAINLSGYSFSDAHQNERIAGALSNLVVHPGESVIFVNTEFSAISTCDSTNFYQFVANAAAFVQWWGAANLPANLQIRPYRGSRFNGLGDRLHLFDPGGEVVHSVQLGVATPGRTFGYDPATGNFGKVSEPGEWGVVKAERADDYGSPGRVPQPSPLQILAQPQSQTIEVEMDVTLTVRAGGVPPPSYQWTHDGVPLTNGTDARLTITNVQPADAGDYLVRICNGTTQLLSAVATVTVTTNPYVKILAPPRNLTAYAGQPAKFSVSVKGRPAPTIQWQANGMDIPGATDTLLAVGDSSPEMSGTVYTAQVANEYRSVSASAMLIVAPRPKVAITEVMSLTSFGHSDWFEVTNFDTNEVDLLGYRFSDRDKPDPAYPSFFDQPKVVKITNSIVIKPRESVIFSHHLSAEDFVRWWGKENLPPNVQIHTYSGFALSPCGQVLRLWNAAADRASDTVATAELLKSNLPHSAVVDCNFYDISGYTGEANIASDPEANGAWEAPFGGDLGSPGLTEVTPPHFLGLSPYLNGMALKCRGNPGKTYRLLRKDSLAETQWLPVASRVAANSLSFPLFDVGAKTNATRFYSLEEVP